MKPRIALIGLCLLAVGCQNQKATTNEPELNQMPANVVQEISGLYVGKFRMEADPDEARDLKEAGIPIPSLEVKADGTWLWDDMEVKKEGKWKAFEGELTLEMTTEDGKAPNNTPEVPMALSRLDEKADKVLLKDSYRKVEFTFVRESLQNQPVAPANEPSNTAPTNG